MFGSHVRAHAPTFADLRESSPSRRAVEHPHCYAKIAPANFEAWFEVTAT